MSTGFARYTHTVLKYLPICLVVCVAAFLRLYRISEYMTFLGDEGRDVLIVRKMLVEYDIPFIGPTASVGGFFLGPLYYYLMAPFLLLWNFDPVGPAIMVAPSGIATVYLLYAFVSKVINPISGLISASVYAVSPLVIAYSRSSWNPNLVPITSLITIYLLWKYSLHSSNKILFTIFVICGFGLQFHYLYLFMILLSVFWILRTFNTKSIFTTISLSISGFVIGQLPFFLFELKNHFPNIRSIFAFIQAGKDTGFEFENYIHTVSTITLRLFGRLLFRMPQEEIWLGLYDFKRWIWEVPIWVFIIVTFYILLQKILNLKKKFNLFHSYKYNCMLLFLYWFVTVIGMFGFYKRSIYDYYLGILFPFPFVLLGIFFEKLMKYTYGNILTIILWGVIIYWNLLGNPFQFQPNNQLGQMKKIAIQALELTDDKPYNFALITNFNSDHAYRYFLEVYNRKPITIESFEKDPARNTVTEQLIVICEIECHPLGNSLWEVAGFGRAQIDKSVLVPFVTIYRLVRYNTNNE